MIIYYVIIILQLNYVPRTYSTCLPHTYDTIISLLTIRMICAYEKLNGASEPSSSLTLSAIKLGYDTETIE